MKYVIKVENLNDLPLTNPLLAMDNNKQCGWVPKMPNNEIWYKSSNGQTITPKTSALPTIISNAYSDSKGVIKFASGVTTIGESAFEDCDSLTSVTIPNSVTHIGHYVFENCNSLISVIIPNSVTSIKHTTFQGCNSLTTIDVAVDNLNYSSGNGVLFNKDKTTLIKYPGGKLGSYIIPSSVTNIENNAFSGCTGLTSVAIPNSVTSIGESAFRGCSGLSSVAIPSSINTIDEMTFANCNSLTSVTIPNSVTSIGKNAFDGCNSLTSVTIGNSVTNIGSYAFRGCTSLTSISYAGTMSQWSNISKGTEWYQNVPATVVHCSDGDVNL